MNFQAFFNHFRKIKLGKNQRINGFKITFSALHNFFNA